MPWRDLSEFRDPTIPKLANLDRARRKGLVVPGPTLWALAADLERPDPRGLSDVVARVGLPCIIRSGAPTEDTAVTSNAGQLMSLVVRAPGDFPEAVARVVAALPRADVGPLGVVFVQPLVEADVAGITLFDGFYYEETRAKGTNMDLTSGRRRGDVRRGHLRRGDPHDTWLRRVHRVFGGRLDLEWAQTAAGQHVLFQVRPALFPVRRNETLSLANHKEILGDPPSPWMAGVVVEVGRPILGYLETIEPAAAAWDEPYAVELAARAWLNFSPLFRLMDHWGLPRTLVTEGLGGDASGPDDARFRRGRFLRKLPTMALMGLLNFREMSEARVGRGLRILDAELGAARSLRDLQRVNVRAMEFSIRTNFAIMQVLSVASRWRRALGLRQAARVVTHSMMAQYARLASRPEVADRLRGIDAWLRQYGHRGPLESDPWQPRFAELRAVLEADLRRGPAPPPREHPQPPPSPWLLAPLSRFLFLSDERRERFRDRLMRRWQTLRVRILEEARRAVAAGHLDTPDDVFFLRSEDLAAAPASWRARVAARRSSWGRAKGLALPTTASRDALEAAIRLGEPDEDAGRARSSDRFTGIGLGSAAVRGTAVRAEALGSLLNGRVLPEEAVLVVPTLEPSWAVVFPRFAAVVAELGGELSHAAILLREAGIPSVVNAQGAFGAIAEGDRVRVDPARGEVVIEARPRPA
jgi:phosphohistidine swiveling domain-containing protein